MAEHDGALAPSQVGGHGQDEGEGGEGRGLQLERAHLEPPLGPKSAAPERAQHRQQTEQDGAVGEDAQDLEVVVVDQHHDDHDRQADDGVDQLLLEIEARIDAGELQLASGRRVDHHHAHGRHGQRGEGEEHVDVLEDGRAAPSPGRLVQDA